MRKKEAYNKLFRAKDELYEALEIIQNEEKRKGKRSAKLEKIIEYVETAADQTQAALMELEEA